MTTLRMRALARTALVRVTPARASRKVVLCYHSLDERLTFATPRGLFAEHLGWLAEHCDVVDLSSIRDEPATPHRPRVAITFDDGYSDNHSEALPLLVEHGLTATFFITTGFVAGDEAVRTRMRALAGGVPVEALTWGMVREMKASGMSIGSHSHSHPNLARDAAGATAELTRSREIVQEQLGERIAAIAYPFGKPRRHVTAATIAAARVAGYELGVVVLHRGVRASDDPLQLPRFFVTNDPIVDLSAKIAGHHDLVGVYQERTPAWLARIVAPEDFRV